MELILTNDDYLTIDRGSMRTYINSVHKDDNNDDCFIIWAERRLENDEGALGPWKQHGYKWTDLFQHIRKISLDGQKNMYLSLQTFCAPFRRAETLFKLNAIGFDIDLHNADGDIFSSINQTLLHLEIDVFSSKALPDPSMIIFTGRGLQILYILESLPKQGLPLWKLVGEAMARRIHDCLDKYCDGTVKLGKLDENYGDVTRVLRIPGTFNTAANLYARIAYPVADAEIIEYRLDDLRDRYLPELIPKAKPNKANGQAPRKIVNLFNTYSLHVARLEDIVKLRDLRHEKNQPEDYRRRMVFLYRYWSCFYVGHDIALEAALEFNAGFKQPLSDNIVRSNTMSAQKAYFAWREDNKRGYNYRNETLIRLLDITEEEQQHMKTIISHEEKKRRRQLRNWDNTKRDNKSMQLSQERDDEVANMLKAGCSYREIEAKTGVTYKTAKKIADSIEIIRPLGRRKCVTPTGS